MDTPSITNASSEQGLLKTLDEKLSDLQKYEIPPSGFDHLVPEVQEQLQWPSRKVLGREMFLTSDNSSKAKYLTSVYDILKKRKSFRFSKDSAEDIQADWRMLAMTLFTYAFETLENWKLHKATETAWFRCFDKAAMKKHASAKYRNCYFFYAVGQWLLLFQGTPEGPKEIAEFDMSDRFDRRALVTVIRDTNPPKPKSKVATLESTTDPAAKEKKKPVNLKRKDLSRVLEKTQPVPRISVDRYRKRQKQWMARKKTALGQVMYSNIDVEMETEEEDLEMNKDTDM